MKKKFSNLYRGRMIQKTILLTISRKGDRLLNYHINSNIIRLKGKVLQNNIQHKDNLLIKETIVLKGKYKYYKNKFNSTRNN